MLRNELIIYLKVGNELLYDQGRKWKSIYFKVGTYWMNALYISRYEMNSVYFKVRNELFLYISRYETNSLNMAIHRTIPEVGEWSCHGQSELMMPLTFSVWVPLLTKYSEVSFLTKYSDSIACTNNVNDEYLVIILRWLFLFFYWNMRLRYSLEPSWRCAFNECRGWLDGAKVSCIVRHRCMQLILAYNLARPAILVAGKGRGEILIFLLFLHFHSCSSFFPVPPIHIVFCHFYVFSPFLWETSQNDSQGLTCR